MEAEEVLTGLIERFLDKDIDIADFEVEFLRIYKDLPIRSESLREPLGRAFLAVEAYDPARTVETQTLHNIAFETLVAELREALREIRERGSPS